jgi:hypothetical protein
MARPGMEKLKDQFGIFQAANLVDFAKTHPISAGADVGMKGISVASAHDRNKILKDKRVASATMDKAHRPSEATNLCYVMIQAPYAAGTALPAGRFLIWYLPWNPEGGQVSMFIPTSPVLDDTGANVSPSIFFTAQVTGCSVFIRGTAKHPEIFHGGSAAAKTWPGSSQLHWRELFAQVRPRSFKKGAFVEINKTNYLGGETFGRKFNTAMIDNYEATIKRTETAPNFTLLSVMGFGCVFGVRDGAGDWSFYLQENARVAYSRVPNPQFSDMVYANRTLRLTKVFPANVVEHTNLLPKALP